MLRSTFMQKKQGLFIVHFCYFEFGASILLCKIYEIDNKVSFDWCGMFRNDGSFSVSAILIFKDGNQSMKARLFRINFYLNTETALEKKSDKCLNTSFLFEYDAIQITLTNFSPIFFQQYTKVGKYDDSFINLKNKFKTKFSNLEMFSKNIKDISTSLLFQNSPDAFKRIPGSTSKLGILSGRCKANESRLLQRYNQIKF